MYKSAIQIVDVLTCSWKWLRFCLDQTDRRRVACLPAAYNIFKFRETKFMEKNVGRREMWSWGTTMDWLIIWTSKKNVVI